VDRGGTVFKVLCYKSNVAGSIPACVNGIIYWHNPSDRTMALRSTPPLTEISTTSISWGKGGRCVRLTNLTPSCTVVMKSGKRNFLEPCGPVQACNGNCLFFSTFLLKTCAQDSHASQWLQYKFLSKKVVFIILVFFDNFIGFLCYTKISPNKFLTSLSKIMFCFAQSNISRIREILCLFWYVALYDVQKFAVES